MEACKRQPPVESEALGQARLLICEEWIGVIDSADISGVAYVGILDFVLGSVVPAPAGEEFAMLLQKLPDRPMTARLVTELKKFAKSSSE